MYPEDPMNMSHSNHGSGHNGSTLLSETEFHNRSQMTAQALLSEVADDRGKIKAGVDPIRVERALSAARQVIEAIRKARDSMHKEREDRQFEYAVIEATRSLPEQYQTSFLTALEQELSRIPKHLQ